MSNLPTPEQFAEELSDLATWRHVSGDLQACLNKEKARGLITERDAQTIRAACAWLAERGNGRAAEDVLHNITDPGQPFAHLGVNALVKS